jgi:glycosyltransferase involved in cell wall biosynthesis
LDLEMFSPQDKRAARAALSLPENRRLVLFGGNPTVPRKRFSLAQEAIALLNGQPDVELVVPRGVPHRQIPLYMNACDALVLASLHEGSPNVVKEALACNLPVVSVDVGDARERIGSLPGCVVCQDDRPETIAAALTEVLNQKTPFNGRDAVKDLDELLLTPKVIDVYRRAMRRRGK